MATVRLSTALSCYRGQPRDKGEESVIGLAIERHPVGEVDDVMTTGLSGP